ncbi:EamA family transporter [Cognatishimia sp. WU-CL00825]
MLTFSMLVSLSFSLGGLVASDISPSALTAIRFAIALALLFAIMRVLAVPIGPALHGFPRFAIVGGLMAVYFITMFEALAITTPVATSAVFTLTPLMAAGFGLVLVQQKSGSWTLSALVIGAFGALWVIFRADISAFIALDIGRGELIFLVGALAHASVPALLRKLGRGELPLQSTFATILGALILTTLYAAPALIKTDFMAVRPLVWLVILYLAIFTTAASFFLLQFANRHLPASKVMAYTYLVPSWVVLWEFLLHGTTQPTILMVGVFATLAALLMLLRGAESERK